MEISARIVDRTPVEGVRLLAMKTGVRDVITISGSLYGGDLFSPRENPVIAEMTAAMLDQGTEEHSREEISTALESVGASLNFSSDRYRVRFQAQCLRENLDLVVRLLAEQLRRPAFPGGNLEVVIQRSIGHLRRELESTRCQAQGQFLRTLYRKEHPNYIRPVEADIDLIGRVGEEDLRAFQKRSYGLGNLQVVAVGDVDARGLEVELARVFQNWVTSPLEHPGNKYRARRRADPSAYVTMQEKTSADMFLGQAIGIDREHADYHSLMMGVYILGGNFSARLMQTVRDEAGLTYGIGSSVSGVENGNDGYWSVWGTFAPALLKEGHKATLQQVKSWAQKGGVTVEELRAKQTTITGAYKVGLATTRGLTGRILLNAERGHTLRYLDEYPEIINGLTLDQVNAAIDRYVDLEKLSFVAAGSLDEKGQPLESGVG